MSQSPVSVAPLSHTRRRLLRSLFLSGGAVALSPFLKACGDSAALAGVDLKGQGQLGLPPGPLAGIGPVGARDADGIAVPPGFSVRAVARTGTPPALGSPYAWHTFPDGGATYTRPGGGWIYTSNSELPGGAGGCGALVFDADGTVVDAYSILANTSGNCAGGKTPWDTWLSCEENGDDGQVWETDPFGVAAAVPKPALGFFNHEAAAIDPRHRVAYLTEDAGNGRFYRWVADAGDVRGGDRLALESGRLQVMNIRGFENGGYPATEQIRELLPVSWVDVVDPEQGQGAVRERLAAAGSPVPGTQIKGGEGLWYYELPVETATVPPGGLPGAYVTTRGVVFFSSKGDNRVYALDIENQLVELVFDNDQIEPDFADVDNVTVSPWGDILVAEDLTDTGRGARLIVVVPNQSARVLVDLLQPGSEITGPAFSPDGSRLYFSSQRGPNVPGGQAAQPEDAIGSGFGATYELVIPPEYRGA
jgi:hypothetical protein